MNITTPIEIEQAAWDGYLEAPGTAFKGAAALARVVLGEPACWPAGSALASETGKAWTPPAGDRRYTLVRLAFTLYPPDDPRAHYAEATLTAYLRPKQGSGSVIAHDLFPREVMVASKTKFIFKLSPELKFGAGSVSPGEVGAEIEYPRGFPVVQGFGLGESRASWLFSHHGADPLSGCQSVYLVLDAPPDAGGVRLSLELVATLETRFGPLRLGLPEPARAHASRVIAAPPEGGSNA